MKIGGPGPASPEPASAETRLTLFCVAALLLAGVLAYYNSFSGPFLFDDFASIVDNRTIRKLWPLWEALSPPGTGAGVTNRPVVNYSFAINYALGGLDVRGYHAVNLAIHLGAALVLFGIVRRTLRQPVMRPRFGDQALSIAFVSALVWLLHPLQTESVTCAVQRTESLMGLFYLLTLYAAIRAMESPRPRGWQFAAFVACLAGMASKEVMVTAPLMVLLYDRTFVAGTFRAAWQRRKWSYFSLAATWILLAWLVVGMGHGDRGGAGGFTSKLSWWGYLLTQSEGIVWYLKLSLWPHPLVLDYGSYVAANLAVIVPCFALVAILVIATVVAVGRWPVWGFVGAWFFAILAPSSSVLPLATQTLAEHRMYLPLAGVIALAVVGSYPLSGRRGLVVATILAIGFGALTIRRNSDYRSALAIWTDTVAKRPDNARAYLGLADGLLEAGRTVEAISTYEQALRTKPDYALAHNNLANALAGLPGRRPEALGHYEQALQVKPDFALAHNNLANELAKLPGRLQEALPHYQRALRIEPDFAEAHNNLANALAKLPGCLPEALEHYERALRIKPDFVEAHNNLANALAKLPGRLPDAVAQYEQALRIEPDNAVAHNNLANVLAKLPGRLPEALAHYERALQIKPDFAEAHNNLANELVKLTDRVPEALAHYEQALQINPGYAVAHNNLANALAKLPGRQPEALAHYEAAVRIKPEYVEALNNLGVIYARQGRLEDARRKWEQVLELDPKNASALRNLEMLRNSSQAGDR